MFRKVYKKETAKKVDCHVAPSRYYGTGLLAMTKSQRHCESRVFGTKQSFQEMFILSIFSAISKNKILIEVGYYFGIKHNIGNIKRSNNNTFSTFFSSED